MANPMHDYTVQEILNKTYNYTSYEAETMANIGTTLDSFDNLGLSSTNTAREIILIDVTAGGSAAGDSGHISLSINDGDTITLKVANLPFTFDKFPIEKVEAAGHANDDLQVIAFF